MYERSKAFSELRERFKDRFTTDAATLIAHAGGKAHHTPANPDAVFFAESTEEVALAVSLCARERIPLVAFGAGTSLEGQLSAQRGGLSIDLSRMNRVLRVSASDLDCTVQAGVTREDLNQALIAEGLFFPIDAGVGATLGGMVATRASGTNAVRYGTMRENVLALTVVLADGRVIKTGGRARKSAAGYDLTRLLVGSEGTLGIITEVTLRLYAIPETSSVAVCGFPCVGNAVDTAIAVVQQGVPIARMELMDRRLVQAVNAYSGLTLAMRDTLVFEFAGSAAAVAEQIEKVELIAAAQGAVGFEWASEIEARERLWAARKDAFYAIVAQRPGGRGWSSDVCVPVSRLSECILHAQAALDTTQVPAAILGHVGDGNFHAVFSVDPARPEEMAEVARINSEIVDKALSVGGTCSGEHGIGTGKIGYLKRECGEEAIDVMLALKRALDPFELMNPGKVFDAGDPR